MLEKLIYDKDGTYQQQGINLRKLRNFVNTDLTELDLSNEVTLTEEQHYDLYL